jgi:hypothetical protein
VIPLGYFVILLGTIYMPLGAQKSTFYHFESEQGTTLGTNYFDMV